MKNLVIVAFALACVVVDAQEDDQPQLFAFVGEKISIEPVSSSNVDFLNTYRYKAKFRIIKAVYGDLEGDTLEFSGAEHMAPLPGFAECRFVLLFVVKVGAEYFRTKSYSWSAVYRTESGRWAGPYYAADYMFYREHAKDPVLKPERIEFPEEATRIFEESELEDFHLEHWEPYWGLTGNRLVPVQGNYLEDLFELKKIAWLSSTFE